MGHACSKSIDEDLEYMRVERERRLGLTGLRLQAGGGGGGSSQPQFVFVPNGGSTAGAQGPPPPSQGRQYNASTFSSRQHQQQQQQQHQQVAPSIGRPPTPGRSGSQQPRPTPAASVAQQRSVSPLIRVADPPAPAAGAAATGSTRRLSWQPGMPQRGAAATTTAGTIASPDRSNRATTATTTTAAAGRAPSARPLPGGQQQQQQPGGGGAYATLRPMVAQALNQLAAIELQHRMQITNQEFVEQFQLASKLDGLLGLESLRVAGAELHSLERRSRESIASQEAMERRALWGWMGGLAEEARLSDVIRRTLESTILGMEGGYGSTTVGGSPRSSAGSALQQQRRVTSPPRVVSPFDGRGGNNTTSGSVYMPAARGSSSNAAAPPANPASSTFANFDVPKHSSLRWVAAPHTVHPSHPQAFVATSTPSSSRGGSPLDDVAAAAAAAPNPSMGQTRPSGTQLRVSTRAVVGGGTSAATAVSSASSTRHRSTAAAAGSPETLVIVEETDDTQPQRRYASPDTLSAEEAALDAKIQRQRAMVLLANSKQPSGGQQMSPPSRAPPAAPGASTYSSASLQVTPAYPAAAFRDAAAFGTKVAVSDDPVAVAAAREESRQATRRRLNALTGHRLA